MIGATANADSWQQFPNAQFGTRERAARNALALARDAIDIRLAGA